MPTYDYICTSCNNAWELEQRIVEDAVKVCPKCGASTAKRQISAGAGFILKGGGWYADGYGPKAAASSSGGDEGGGKAEKSSGKSDKSETSEKSEKKADTSGAEPAKKADSPAKSESTGATPATPAKPSAA